MRDPYLYDDVNVLKNLADIKNSELLRKAEADITGLAMRQFMIISTISLTPKLCRIFTAISLVRYLIGRENSVSFKW